MIDPRQARASALLDELESGNRAVIDELFELVYDTLRSAARSHRREWQGDYTLNTTAIVHEVYLKLVDRSMKWEGRSHFLGVASKAMRHILVDYARRRKAEKRGGDYVKLSLEEMKVSVEDQIHIDDRTGESLLALDKALKKLAAKDPRAADVVEYRVFGGLTIAQTAEIMGTSPRTVTRDWALAQAWLHKEITRSGDERSSKNP